MLPACYFYELAYDYLTEHSDDEQLLAACLTMRDEAAWQADQTPYTQEQELVLAALKGVSFNISVMLSDENDMATIGEAREFPVTGFWTRSSRQGDSSVIYLPDDTAEALWQEQKEGLSWYEEYQTAYAGSADAVYSVAFLPYDHSQEQTEQFWAMYQDKTFAEDDSRIRLSSSFVDNLEIIDEAILVLEKVFLYGGLSLAAFAALLLSNFISVSIANKKREIGILRAVGARSTDVFKIFFSESFVIALICVALSTVISATACGAINALLAESLGASLFVFGIGSFGLVVGIAVVTAVIATFLPVWNEARKKPVDSIRSL